MKYDTHIFEITDGIYHVMIDFEIRVVMEAIGDGSREGNLSMYFSEAKYDEYGESFSDSELHEVILPFNTYGFVFGEVSKSTYYGTYYTAEAYKKIVTEENEFLTGI